MANPIIKIKRGLTAPSTLQAGELAVDLANKNLYVGDSYNVPLAIGGEGTFATKTYVDTSVSSGLASLTSVFKYIGNISAYHDGPATSSSGAAFLLPYGSMTGTATGSYFTVDVAASYTDGTTTFYAKVGDAIVKTATGWQKIDNVDAVVLPTANEIAVTGDENVGYTVSIDPVFSGRVVATEMDIDDLQTKTQNIILASTTAGTTAINGELLLKDSATFSTGTKIKEVFGRALVIGDDEIFVGAAYGNAIVSALGVNAPDLSLNGAKVNIGGSYNPSAGSGNYNDNATEVRINSVVVKGSASGLTTLEDFVIDGGVY